EPEREKDCDPDRKANRHPTYDHVGTPLPARLVGAWRGHYDFRKEPQSKFAREARRPLRITNLKAIGRCFPQRHAFDWLWVSPSVVELGPQN
ncbi:MAG: hypothetical protein ABL871_07105, partial [Terricaulis sp.]